MLFEDRLGSEPLRIDILVIDGFSLLSLASTMEPLRAANRVSGRELYRWRLLGLGGRQATSSSGVPLTLQESFQPSDLGEVLIVVSAFEHERNGAAALPLLRAVARQKRIPIGGVEAGSWILARAGLLDRYRATTHWEDVEDFALAYPNVEVVRDRYVIDRDRFTTGGASPAFDLMLELIRSQHGPGLALDVSSIFIYDESHPGADPQPMVSTGRLDRAEPRLTASIRLMEERIDAPSSIAELARRAGMTARGLQKLFRRHLDTSPGAYYLNLRLAAARRMLELAGRPVLEAAAQTGFTSSSAFARAFRRRYGISPGRVKAR
ncbi:transcriptional regulator, AraC family with amidase-like domain [Rhizobiales bacterium GAS188]|nr:transcriptional regulator, AraC family with amidase-like domain [Rhizobiales bacterium GAS188]